MAYVSPDEGSSSSGGGGPDDPTRNPAIVRRSQGFLALAFGLALGLSLMVFFAVFHFYHAPIDAWQPFFDLVKPNLWLTFLYGFVGGSLIAGFYNMLVIRRLQFFGLVNQRD